MNHIIGTRAHELLETYVNARQSQEEQQTMRIIQNAVVDALEPFHTGHIWVEMSASLDTGNHIMQIQLDNLIDDPFTLEIRRDVLASFSFAQELGYYVAEKAHDFYTSLYIQPEDNIVLGEC